MEKIIFGFPSITPSETFNFGTEMIQTKFNGINSYLEVAQDS